jgi:hypothetical protein
VPFKGRNPFSSANLNSISFQFGMLLMCVCGCLALPRTANWQTDRPFVSQTTPIVSTVLQIVSETLALSISKEQSTPTQHNTRILVPHTIVFDKLLPNGNIMQVVTVVYSEKTQLPPQQTNSPAIPAPTRSRSFAEHIPSHPDHL